MAVQFWSDPVNPAEFAYLQHQAAEELEEQKRIVRYRELFDNELPQSLLLELQYSLLSESANDIMGAFNYFETVIDEISNRLAVVDLVDRMPSRDPQVEAVPTRGGVVMSDEFQGDPMRPFERTVQWAMEWWDRHNMDQLHDELIEYALIDSESYLILQPEYNQEGELDIFPYVHRRYTSSMVGGDNLGVKLHYENEKLVLASKRWLAEETEGGIIDGILGLKKGRKVIHQYMTLYVAQTFDEQGNIVTHPEIIKLKMVSGNENNVQWAEIGREPLPAGMCVVPFTAPGRRSRGKNAAGPQDLLSNLQVGLSIGASMGSLPTLSVIGGYATIDGEAPLPDGSNLWKLGAGTVLNFPTKTPEQAAISYVLPADMSQVIAAINLSVNHLAITTGTPSLMSQNVRADAAAELIRRIESRPIAVARKAQISFGNSFTQLFKTLGNYLAHYTSFPTGNDRVYVRWQTADTAVTAIAGSEEKPVVSNLESDALERVEEAK